MRLVRFRSGTRIATGSLEGEFVRPLRGTFFQDPVPTGEDIPLGEVRLLSPLIPSKIVAIGKNYVEHAEEMGNGSRRASDLPEALDGGDRSR